MKEIKIVRLCLENFKCHKAMNLDFKGGNASVYGDNATGKTSIYDALTWLLFAKDSQGNGEKNVEIKPLDENGQVRDHEALTAVEAVLDVGGEQVVLRRTYKEVWTTKRGSSQATFDGNTSEYYVDGVPCKRNAFAEKVSELVDEETFRMLTSVSHFSNGLSWQDRRAVLFKVAGVMDDAQILETDARFAPLVESMGRLSLEDYKKKLLAEKKKFAGAKTEIPARISECEKTIEDVSGLDFAGAAAEASALQAKIDGISSQMVALRQDSAAEAKRMEIREAQLSLTSLESENRLYRASQSTGDVDIHGLNIRLTALQTRLDKAKQQLASESSYITDLDRRISDSRTDWITVNSEMFSGGVCATCGQVLPEDKLRSAQEAFEAGKAKRLKRIEESAAAHKENKAVAEERFERVQVEVHEIEEEMGQIRQSIADAQTNRKEPVDMDGFAEKWQALRDQIQALSAELSDMTTDAMSLLKDLDLEKAQLQQQLREVMETVNKESLLNYARRRVEELRAEAKSAAECLDAIEKMLYLMEDYARYKTGFVEDSINRLFRIARFRLFREQANGGVEDRCDVVYDGVPYMGLNSAMKVNVGIDIINTLSVAYGVRVPLFVDNAESVTNLERCGSQIIRLVVSENDKELRVNYEN